MESFIVVHCKIRRILLILNGVQGRVIKLICFYLEIVTYAWIMHMHIIVFILISSLNIILEIGFHVELLRVNWLGLILWVSIDLSHSILCTIFLLIIAIGHPCRHHWIVLGILLLLIVQTTLLRLYNRPSIIFLIESLILNCDYKLGGTLSPLSHCQPVLLLKINTSIFAILPFNIYTFMVGLH